jgi:hypothetical protein
MPKSRFRQAIKTGPKQRANSLKLQPTMSLARLPRDSVRREQARAVLGNLRLVHPGGFCTADFDEGEGANRPARCKKLWSP